MVLDFTFFGYGAGLVMIGWCAGLIVQGISKVLRVI